MRKAPTPMESFQYYAGNAYRLPHRATEPLAATEVRLLILLSLDPLNPDVAGLLVVVMGELDRWQEAAAVTRRLVRAAPTRGRAWALHGLTLARTQRWAASLAAFDTAFQHLSAGERAPFRDLSPIGGRTNLPLVGEAEGERLDSLYWWLAQPVALAEANQARAEFYARVVYVQHALGSNSYLRSRYLRYGPPDVKTRAGWLYLRPEFAVAGGRLPGQRDGTLPPARFDNMYRTLDTILVQTARFRGPGDSTAVAVFGAIPLRRITDSVAVRDLPLVSGAIVADRAGRELQRDRHDETVTGVGAPELQYRSWRLALLPGTYLLRVEAHLPSLARAAKAIQPLDVAAVPATGLALSDLLIARRVVPRDSEATRWDEFLVEPNAGRFEPGEPVGLLWETYNLTPDSAGITRHEVSLRITVEAIERKSIFAHIVGGIADAMGLTALGDDRASLVFTREVAASPDGARAEYLIVDLRGAPAGRYGIEVAVRDQVTGQEASTARTITVGDEPVQRVPAWARPR